MKKISLGIIVLGLSILFGACNHESTALKTKSTTPVCLAKIEKQIFNTPQFARVKEAYNETLDTPNDGEWEQFLGYYFNLEKVNDKDYEIALVENYSDRSLNSHFFKVEKENGQIFPYDIITDSYDEALATDPQYANFFTKNCQNLGKNE